MFMINGMSHVLGMNCCPSLHSEALISYCIIILIPASECFHWSPWDNFDKTYWTPTLFLRLIRKCWKPSKMIACQKIKQNTTHTLMKYCRVVQNLSLISFLVCLFFFICPFSAIGTCWLPAGHSHGG